VNDKPQESKVLSISGVGHATEEEAKQGRGGMLFVIDEAAHLDGVNWIFLAEWQRESDARR
jgi:hypothetical protein